MVEAKRCAQPMCGLIAMIYTPVGGRQVWTCHGHRAWATQLEDERKAAERVKARSKREAEAAQTSFFGPTAATGGIEPAKDTKPKAKREYNYDRILADKERKAEERRRVAEQQDEERGR